MPLEILQVPAAICCRLLGEGRLSCASQVSLLFLVTSSGLVMTASLLKGETVNLDRAPVASLSSLAKDTSPLNTVSVNYSLSRKSDCAKEAKRYNM